MHSLSWRATELEQIEQRRNEVNVVKKPGQRVKSKTGKGARAAAANVHQMPAGGRRRATPVEEPVAFPNVPTIVANAVRAAVATDGKNQILHWNDAAIELFGFTAEEVMGRNLQTVIQARDVHGNRLSADYGAFHEMIRIGEAPQSFEIAIITATGKMIRIAVAVVVVLGPQPAEYALVYLMTPMHRRRRADEAIDRLLAQFNLPGVTVPGTTVSTGAEQRGTSKQRHLTRRQLEVLLLLAEGKRSGEIAEELGISVHTVRTHIQGILRTLGAANRLEAVSRALHERII
jgi:PAS domain S-box-containing protein